MMVMVKLKETVIENISYQEQISPITMYYLMAETFIINQLMIKSKSMMKLEKLQQEKEMITQLVVQ